MVITLNGKKHELDRQELKAAVKDKIIIVRGYQVDEDFEFHDGDELILIERGKMPEKAQMKMMLNARHTPEVNEKVQATHVVILGLGGLGSNVALMLARLGIGKLTLIDFDIVEPSNLNRQCYRVRDLTRPKAIALAEQIADVNPYIEVAPLVERVTAENVIELINGADIAVEAFDRAELKAEIADAILSRSDIRLVAASGMAGYGSANEIKTRRIGRRLILAGDSVSDSRVGVGLMSPRVTLCAAHQANAVLRLLMELEP